MRLQHQFLKYRSSNGFSLLEVMITITVLSLVLFIGIPGFQTLFASARERAATSSFVTAMNLARSEAVTRNAFTRVCITSACGQGIKKIRVEVETDKGKQELLRSWDTENSVAYKSGDNDGLSVRFSPLGLAVDASGDQLKAALDVSIMDTSAGTSREMSGYCVSVTGGVYEKSDKDEGCN